MVTHAENVARTWQ